MLNSHSLLPLINTTHRSADIKKGFLAYLVSNLSFYYSPLIRAQYAARNRGHEPTVQFNDITFAAHALLLSLIITSQYSRRLWGFTASSSSPGVAGGRRPSRIIMGVGCGCVAGVAAVVVLVAASPGRDATDGAGARGWVWLDVVYAVSYVKLLVTLVKYTPQLLVNYRNRSTRGWSIVQVLLDFTGGILSIAQLAIDSYLQGDWSGITGNPVKLALGNVSIIYDLLFMTQHYILYPGAGGKAEEREPMLGGREDEERRID